MERHQIEQQIRAVEQRATPGPWAWESIAEKSNEFAVGQAFDKDGQPIAGRLPEGEDIEDTVIERRLVGMNESGHANFADAELICLLRNHVADLLAPSPEARPTCWMPIETAPTDMTLILCGNCDNGEVQIRYGVAARDENGGEYMGPEVGCAPYWLFTHWMPLPDPPAASPLPAPKEQE